MGKKKEGQGEKASVVHNRTANEGQEEEQKPLVHDSNVKVTADPKKTDAPSPQSVSTQVPVHIYQEPQASGISYTEFPMLSLVLHFALFTLLIIMYCIDSREKALLWVAGFFYVGIQLEGMVGEIPSIFKNIRPVHSDVSGLIRGWKQNWLNLSMDIASFHYIQKNVYGQKRRSKKYSYGKTIQFEYATCEDVTADATDYLSREPIVIVKREISYSFGNEKAEQAYKAKMQPEIEAAQKEDKFTEQETQFSFKNLENDPQSFVYKRESSIFVNRFFFWVTSILLFTIPYRFYVNSLTAHLTYKIHKKIYV